MTRMEFPAVFMNALHSSSFPFEHKVFFIKREMKKSTIKIYLVIFGKTIGKIVMVLNPIIELKLTFSLS
jgi:hypothetical protein